MTELRKEDDRMSKLVFGFELVLIGGVGGRVLVVRP